MKQLVVLPVLVILIAVNVQAQTAGQVATYTSNSAGAAVSDGLYHYAMGSMADRAAKSRVLDENIEGSPYESNNFSPGKLYFGEELVGELFYRYNAYNEEIEVKQQNLEGAPIEGLSKDKQIRLVQDNGKPISFKTFLNKSGDTRNGYLTLLKAGDYNLYEHLRVNFKDAKKAPNSLVKGTPAKFTQNTDYYLGIEGDTKIQQIQFNKKKLLQLISPADREAVNTFLKTEKIKVKTVEDLFKVVDVLNQ